VRIDYMGAMQKMQIHTPNAARCRNAKNAKPYVPQ